MKIIELNISEFGKLKNTKIRLDDGINIISGDNESGKSTVMLFIRFMFYGLPKKSQKNNYRERSLSFDTHRAAGSMLIERDGRQYRIERTATGAGKGHDSLKIFDMQSGELVAGEPWELFLGVGADVFESSCAVHQSRASSIDKSGASHALDNILASADESIDVSGILDSIDKVRREYKLNRGEGGILYEINREIAELESKKQRALEKQLEINRLQTQLSKLEDELEAVDTEKKNAQAALDVAKKAQILSRFDALEQKRQEKEQLEDELRALDSQFAHKGILPTEQTATNIENACGEIRRARTKIKDRKDEQEALAKRSELDFPLAALGEAIAADGGAGAIFAKAQGANKAARAMLGSAVALSLAAAGLIVTAVLITLNALLFAGAALGVCGIALFAASAKKRAASKNICKKYAQSISTLEAYLQKCEADLNGSKNTAHELTAATAKREAAEQDLISAQNALVALLPDMDATSSADELLTRSAKICADIRALCAQKNDLLLRIAACEALISNHKSSLAEYDEREIRAELGSAVSSAMSIAEADRALSFATSKKDSLVRNVSIIREQLAASRASVASTPVELGDRISDLYQKLDARSRYFDALMLAKESIERASDAMSGNVTPEISRKASEIMERISGGKHPALRTTKQLELSVDEDGFGFSAELLSEGARDAAYIALRISLMLSIFGDQLPPLMLDDALCQFDDNRARIMIDIISRLSEIPLQSVIFTCHAREKMICEENGISHTYTRLN